MQDALVTANEVNGEAKRGPGRPATITLDVVEKVACHIARGMTEEQSCLLVGVNHDSFRTARHRNPEFETAVKRGQAEFLDESLDVIKKGTKGWQGRAWILERRHGDQFRRKTEVNALVGTYSPADKLMHKPLEQWTREDFDVSLGAWKVLQSFSPEQLEALFSGYLLAWGQEMSRWTDDKLEWVGVLDRRMKELASEEQPGEPQLAA